MRDRPDVQAFETARARWQAAGIDDYRCTWTWQLMIGTPRFSVEVRDGKVVSTSLAGQPPTYMGPEQFTVSGAFQRLQRLAREADTVEVTYDPELGYPSKVSVDMITNAVDDEFTFGIHDLVPLS